MTIIEKLDTEVRKLAADQIEKWQNLVKFLPPHVSVQYYKMPEQHGNLSDSEELP